MSLEDNPEELIQAQSHVWNHLYSFINSMTLKCAVELGIPDIIYKHGSPITLSELVASLPIHPAKSPFVRRLMRFLVHSGFFRQQTVLDKSGEIEVEAYTLTNASHPILKGNLSVAPVLLAALDPILISPWHNLSVWFQNEDLTPVGTTHGRGFWELYGQEQKLNILFNEGMAGDARLVSHVLLGHKGIFEGLQSLVDVGGSTGTMVKAIAKAYPELTCIVLDLPHVVDGLQDTSMVNVKYVGGDMFEAVPHADAILLKWILHGWADEDCVKILKRCKEAIKDKEGGKVIIIDIVLNYKMGDTQDEQETKSIETQLFFDMLMMTFATGREREEKEWAKLFKDAGFSSYKISPILGLRSVIQVYP